VSVELSGNCVFQSGSINSQNSNIEVTASGKVNITGLETGELEVDITGTGDIKLENLIASEIDTEINGSGDLELAGAVGNQELEINGSGDYKASRLISEKAYIEIRGSGDVEISVQKQLTAEIMRGADLVYYGVPELDVDISGRGKSRNAGNIPAD